MALVCCLQRLAEESPETPVRPSHDRELKSLATGDATNRDIANQVLAGINFFGNDFQLPKGAVRPTTNPHLRGNATLNVFYDARNRSLCVLSD